MLDQILALLPFLTPVIEAFIGKYGVLVQALAIMASLRLVLKPILAAIPAVVEATPSKSDDVLWNKVKSSPYFTVVLFLLDYFASLKIQVKKPEPVEPAKQA